VLAARSSSLLLAIALIAGCPGPKRPVPPAGAVTLEIGRAGGSLRGVAGDEQHLYAAVTTADKTAA
jgi:hypothetical protein